MYMLNYIAEALILFKHNAPQNRKLNHIHTSSQNMEKKCNMLKINILPPSLEKMEKVHQRSHRHLLVLRTGS